MEFLDREGVIDSDQGTFSTFGGTVRINGSRRLEKLSARPELRSETAEGSVHPANRTPMAAADLEEIRKHPLGILSHGPLSLSNRKAVEIV